MNNTDKEEDILSSFPPSLKLFCLGNYFMPCCFGIVKILGWTQLFYEGQRNFCYYLVPDLVPWTMV